jgi:hypothetical protein
MSLSVTMLQGWKPPGTCSTYNVALPFIGVRGESSSGSGATGVFDDPAFLGLLGLTPVFMCFCVHRTALSKCETIGSSIHVLYISARQGLAIAEQ